MSQLIPSHVTTERAPSTHGSSNGRGSGIISTVLIATMAAIQITTAAAVCAVVDLHVAGELPGEGFVRQEDVDYDKFISNRFGKHYASEASAGDDTPLRGDTAVTGRE